MSGRARSIRNVHLWVFLVATTRRQEAISMRRSQSGFERQLPPEPAVRPARSRLAATRPNVGHLSGHKMILKAAVRSKASIDAVGGRRNAAFEQLRPLLDTRSEQLQCPRSGGRGSLPVVCADVNAWRVRTDSPIHAHAAHSPNAAGTLDDSNEVSTTPLARRAPQSHYGGASRSPA